MKNLTYREAREEAIVEEMRRDASVIIWGEDLRYGIMGLGGRGLLREFGPARVFDPPVSENAMIGIGVGAAAMGFRPIIDMNIANFATLGFDQLINQAAKIHYMSAGQIKCPILVHINVRTFTAGGGHHSDRNYPALTNVPGLKVICPTTPQNAKGLWKTAIRDDNPCVIFEHTSLAASRQEVPEDDYAVPFGKADMVREGKDVTLVCIFTRNECLKAAAELEKKGISVEIIDPLTLVPLDIDAILASVEKTGLLAIADIAHDTGSAASHISALVAERAFKSLRGPIRRICTPDVVIPHSRPLESIVFPTTERIAQTVESAFKASRQ